MNIVLGLFDIENLLTRTLSMIDKDMHLLPVERRPSITSALTKTKRWVESIGDIYGLYVFAPLHVIFSYQLLLHNLGFITVSCPKIPLDRLEKKERIELIQMGKKDKDTTDDTLIKEGTKWIDNIPGITHVIIGSGDHGYKEMLKRAKMKGIKVGAVMGEDITSHSKKILPLIDLHPVTNEKMFHVFSPSPE